MKARDTLTPTELVDWERKMREEARPLRFGTTHGSLTRYSQGCHCEPCRGAKAATNRAYRARVAGRRRVG